MKWCEWLDKWSMTGLKINTGFLNMEWRPKDADRAAAWELYVELLTRVSTQTLIPEHGDEKSALKSIFKMFDLTRNVLKKQGRSCSEFAKIAIVILNQVIRPFTSKWHREDVQGAFHDVDRCLDFRNELTSLQTELRKYTKMLADMASVEDLTNFDDFNLITQGGGENEENC